MKFENLYWFLAGAMTPYMMTFLLALYYRVRAKLFGRKAPKTVGKIEKVEETEEGIIVTGIVFDKQTRERLSEGLTKELSIGYDDIGYAREATFVIKEKS